MQDIICQQLDQIDELFPPERLVKSKARWTRLWHGEEPLDRLPFLMAPFQFGYYVAGLTSEQCLQANLEEILARGQVQDDFIPCFFPGCRQSTIPTMFGAEEIVMESDYTCRRLIDQLEDIDRLPEPSLGPGTVAYEWLHMQQYVLQETEGRLPIHVTDMQGPADVCGQLCGYDAFLSSAYEDPARYHHLMTRATEAFILFWEAQRRLCGEQFVGTHLWGWNWVPADAGASVSVDSLVMVSPAFYQEFYQPYLQRIGELFGGLSVHSCGDFSAVTPVLCATPTLKAVNAGEMSIAALQQAGVDGRTLIIAGAAPETLEATFQLIRDQQLRVAMSIHGMWPVTQYGVKPVAEWNAEDRDGMRRYEERIIGLSYEF